MPNTQKEFAEFEKFEVPETLKAALGKTISQGAKEVERAHQDRQRQLTHAFHNSDRFCAGTTEKQDRLKEIKITVSPLPPQQMKKEISGRAARLEKFRREMGPEFFEKLGKDISEGLREVDRQRISLRNYRAWAWARNRGLIIKTGRMR